VGTFQRLGPEALDAALDALLASDDVRVAAIIENGLFVPVPPGPPFEGCTAIKGASTALDLVVPRDVQAVFEAWEAALADGAGMAIVHLVDDPVHKVALHFLDARHRVGVYAGVLMGYRQADGEAGSGALKSRDVGRPRTALVRKNSSAVFLDVDDALTRILGWDAGELVGKRALELTHPDDRQRALLSWVDMLATPGSSRKVRVRHPHRDGSWVWFEITNTNRLDDPQDPHVAAEMVDLTAEMASQEVLYADADRLVTATLGCLLRHCDATGGAVGIVQHGAQQAWARHGLPGDVDFATLSALALDGVGERPLPEGTLLVAPAVSDAGLIGFVALVTRAPCDEATRRMVALLVDSLGVAIDALRSHEQLVQAASHDTLTGLANRDRFLDLVRHALARGRRTARYPAICVLGIDDFETIRDSLGPIAGDKLLLEMATRLRDAVRAEDTPARFGDDGFAVVIEQAGEPQEAASTTERLLDRLNTPVHLGDRPISVTVSIGVAIPTDGTTAGSLLEEARAALIAAKCAGKARFRIFDPSMQAAAERQTALKARLAGAIEHGELEIAYQPIVHVGTHRIAGVEALLRWTSSEYGVVPPVEFIPLAEQTGMIHMLGQWVLRHACEQAHTWNLRFAARSPYVSVNLSALQVQDDQLSSAVTSVLSATRLPADRLVLELTESVFLRDTTRVLDHLHNLRSHGVRLALDDFGTGYSSLSYLQRFPFDLIKLDKSFIDHLGTTPNNALVRGVLELTRALSIATVAEGVEQPEQAHELADLRCDFVQGYLFSRPVDADRVDDLLRRGTLDFDGARPSPDPGAPLPTGAVPAGAASPQLATPTAGPNGARRWW
jgi:diguanylate cyclase (GGDEF)-like protein/PAS domain S-box-containing protein